MCSTLCAPPFAVENQILALLTIILPYSFMYEGLLATGGIVKLRRNCCKNMGHLYLPFRAFFKCYMKHGGPIFWLTILSLDGIAETSLLAKNMYEYYKFYNFLKSLHIIRSITRRRNGDERK